MVKFLIIATGCNCAEYVEDCLESIKKQHYENYSVCIVDDASTDITHTLIMRYRHPSWHIIRNITNSGTVQSRHNAWLAMPKDYDVIVWLDLDDKLYSTRALQIVADTYMQKPSTWLTYGNFIDHKYETHFTENGLHYPEHIHKTNAYRKHPFLFTHLRTFRRQLYEKLSHQDLFVPQLRAYPDYNMLLCMLEMAGPRHITVIPYVIYKYNDTNPLSSLNRFSPALRSNEVQIVRNILPKQPLQTL